MNTLVLILVFMIIGSRADKPPYVDNDLLYEKAMDMLRQQIQLLRNFVGEINNMEGLKSTEPIWRGISNVFTDLSGMFGGGTGRHYQFESYGMLPPPPNINTTELARKARIRLEQTRRDIMELNSQISKTIQEAFGSPHGNDKRNDASRGRSGEKNTKQKDDVGLEQKPVGFEKSTEKDETNFPVAEGFLGFELPIRGSISRDVLKEQLYQEEFDAVSGMSPRELGKILKPLIAKGQINANIGQCHIQNLLSEEKPLTIEP